MDRERQREDGVGWTGRDRERGRGRVDRERQREGGVGWTGRDRERVG